MSLSCNKDVTLDAMPLIENAGAAGKKNVTIAQVHDELPFMYNRTMVDPEYYDLVLRSPECQTTLFGPPNMSVPNPDYILQHLLLLELEENGYLKSM